MRIRTAAAAAVLALVVTATACGRGGGLFRQYEYEEEIYLSLDGTATVYVNASIPALNALRGTSFDTAPNAPPDRAGIRNFFSTAMTHVDQVNFTRRNNRRFAHVKMDVPDLRRLSEAPPFSWSHYQFERDGNQYVYRQQVGAAAAKDIGNVGWTGRETVGFRLHLPSKIDFQNTVGPPERGNILVWQQPLVDRLHGQPLDMEARMETQSILYRTLWLFGWTFVAVAILFVVVIWWVLKKAPRSVEV
jgi:hypothetical protein